MSDLPQDPMDMNWAQDDASWAAPQDGFTSDKFTKGNRPVPAGAFLAGTVPLTDDFTRALESTQGTRDKYLTDSLSVIAGDASIPLHTKLQQAKSTVDSFKRDVPTPSDAFILTTKVPLAKPLADVIDGATTADFRKNLLADAFDQQEVDSGVRIMKDPHPVWSSLTASVSKVIAKGGDAYVNQVAEFAKDKPYLNAWFKDTSDQIGGLGKIKDKLLTAAIEGGVPKAGATAILEVTGALTAPLDQAIIKGAEKGLDIPTDATFHDFMAAMQGVPSNPAVQASLMEPIMGYATGQWQGHPEYLDTWNRNKVAQNGPDWAYKAGLEFAKMGLIEAGIFYMAHSSPTAQRMLWNEAGKEAPKLQRLGKVLTRTLYGAGGYTMVDRQLDELGDIAQDPLGQEFATNLAGQALGEGGVAILGAAIKSGKGLYGILGPKNVGVSPTAKDASSALLSHPDAPKVRASADDAFVANMKEADAPELAAPAIRQNLQGTSLLGETIDHSFTQSVPVTPMKGAIADAKTVADIQSDFSAAAAVNDIKELYFGKEGFSPIMPRDSAFEVNRGIFNLRTRFGEPDTTIGAPMKDYLDYNNEGHGLHAAAFDMIQTATKGLRQDSVDSVLALRHKWEDIAATNPDWVGTETDLIKAGLSKKERRAFWGVEEAFKNYHSMANDISVDVAKRRGHKQLELGLGDNNPLVKIEKDFGDGYFQVSEVRHGSDKDPIKSWKVEASQLMNPEVVVGYKKYYIPRFVDNPKWMIAELDPKTGVTEITHAFQSKSKMVKEYRRLEGLQDGKVRAYGQWGENLNASTFGIGHTSQAVVDTFDAVTIARMRDNLKSAGLQGVEIDDYIKGLNQVSYGSVINKDLAGHRGKGLLGANGEPAKYLADREAIDLYIQNLSYAMVRDGQDSVINKFYKQYREVLDPTKSWDQELPKVYSKNPTLLADAKAVQTTLRTVFKTKTPMAKAWDNVVADFEINNPKVFATLQKIPVFNTLLLDTRHGLGVVKQNTSRIIFMGNTASFFGQWMSNATQMIGAQTLKDPTVLPLAMMDLSRASLVKGYEGITGGVNKDAAALIGAMRRSHWFAEMEINELNFAHPSAIDRMAFAIVKGGELANRGMAFSVARRELMSQHQAGTLLGINRTPFKGKVDDQEFLRLVVDRAKVFAGDMSPAGRINFFQGGPTRELIFQFLAPTWKTFRPYVSPTTTFREKIGAGAAMVALWGPRAIPLAGGIVGLGDVVVFKASGGNDIDKAKTLSNMIDHSGGQFVDYISDNLNLSEADSALLQKVRKRGAVEALTDGEVSLVHKMAADAFLNDIVARMGTSNAHMALPSVSVIAKIGGSASTIFDAAGELWASYEKDRAYREAGVLPPEDPTASDNASVGKLIRSLGEVSPGMGLFEDFVNNDPATRQHLIPQAQDGTWIKRNWDALPLDGGRVPSAKDFFFNQMGIKPKEVIREQAIRDKDVEWGYYGQAVYDKYKNLYNRNLNNPNALVRISQEAAEKFAIMEDRLRVDHEQVLAKLGGTKQEGGKGAINTARYVPGSIYTNWLKDTQRDSRQLGYGLQPSLSTGNDIGVGK